MIYFFNKKNKNADTAWGESAIRIVFAKKYKLYVSVSPAPDHFSRMICPFRTGSSYRTVQSPSHRPFSRLRGATEPHTSCSHGKNCRKKSLHYRYNFVAGKVAKSAKNFFIFLVLQECTKQTSDSYAIFTEISVKKSGCF